VRNPTNVYRAELGGVLFYLVRYREAVENLRPHALEGASESSATAGFWLAMSHHHLGEPDQARQALRRAIRNWKLAAALPLDHEERLRSLCQESKSLLGEIDAPAAAY
jgi:hypothetical protein